MDLGAGRGVRAGRVGMGKSFFTTGNGLGGAMNTDGNFRGVETPVGSLDSLTRGLELRTFRFVEALFPVFSGDVEEDSKYG